MEINDIFFAERLKSGFGCHYGNKIMDGYAFWIRRKKFFRYFKNLRGRLLLDVGSGDCQWIEYFRNAGAIAYSSDQPKVASRSYVNYAYAIDDDAWKKIRCNFDIITMMTVFNFIVPERRYKALMNIKNMLLHFGDLVIIDNLPKKVPEYQKNHQYKEIMGIDQVKFILDEAGFYVKDEVRINWVDTSIFHYLGSNLFSLWLTKFLDLFVNIVPEKSVKYRMLVIGAKKCII